MKTEMVKVTPALARQWLERNTKNRPLRRAHVENLRLAFARGEFVTTHQGIAFATDGELLDGQHRLAAIAQLHDDFSVLMLISTGMERAEAFPVIDSNQAKRTVSDVLRIDRSVAEAATAIARIHLGTQSGLTPTYVAPFLEYAREDIQELLAFCGGASRIWSTAAVRAACVLNMKWNDPDFAKLVYAAMVRRDYDEMPKSAQAANRAEEMGRLSAHDRNDLFVRAFKIFDPSNEHLTKIQVKNASHTIKEVRERLDREVFERIVIPRSKIASGGSVPPAFRSQEAPAVKASQPSLPGMSKTNPRPHTTRRR